eukprot:12998863-Ditylum_brightwellii.AAC.1
MHSLPNLTPHCPNFRSYVNTLPPWKQYLLKGVEFLEGEEYPCLLLQNDKALYFATDGSKQRVNDTLDGLLPQSAILLLRPKAMSLAHNS